MCALQKWLYFLLLLLNQLDLYPTRKIKALKTVEIFLKQERPGCRGSKTISIIKTHTNHNKPRNVRNGILCTFAFNCDKCEFIQHTGIYCLEFQ